MFSVNSFYRIQISCPDLKSAVFQYRRLFSVEPCWSGVLADNETKSVWFKLENTVIELLQSSNLESNRITGLVLAVCEGESEGESIGLEPCFSDNVTYKSPAFSFNEAAYKLPKDESLGLNISIVPEKDIQHFENIAVPKQLPSVDHLVLRASAGDACVELFSGRLGVRLALDQTVPEWGGRMLFFRAGKMTLEVIVPTDTIGKNYFWGLAYTSTDLQAFRQSSELQNINLSALRVGRKPNTQVVSLKSHHLDIPTLIIEHLGN